MVSCVVCTNNLLLGIFLFGPCKRHKAGGKSWRCGLKQRPPSSSADVASTESCCCVRYPANASGIIIVMNSNSAQTVISIL